MLPGATEVPENLNSWLRQNTSFDARVQDGGFTIESLPPGNYLLVLQLFNLSFGILAKAMNAAGSRIDWTFNGAGWVAVGLVFVLALVFEEGTRMRADLEAMI